MQVRMSQSMRESIFAQVRAAQSDGAMLDVYQVAEAIRVKHVEDNVALEDIVETLIRLAGPTLPMVLRAEAKDVLENCDMMQEFKSQKNVRQPLNGYRVPEPL